jgi:hypothetical protein
MTRVRAGMVARREIRMRKRALGPVGWVNRRGVPEGTGLMFVRIMTDESVP